MTAYELTAVTTTPASARATQSSTRLASGPPGARIPSSVVRCTTKGMSTLPTVKTDWTVREDVRAALRARIRRLLRKYKYPPDRAEGAVRQVIEQMETLAPGIEQRG